MRADEFYQSRKGDWESLSRLLDLGQGDMRALSESQVRDLTRLYRAATSDLALAQRDFPRHEITAYLNQLVARAHAMVYRSEPLAFSRLLQFVTSGFPRLFRETWIFTFIAAMLFILPAIASGGATYARPVITCNKNGIPFDPEKPTVTSGIRLGTPAGTTRGFGIAEFRRIGDMIAEVLDVLSQKGAEGDLLVENAVRAKVAALLARYPLYRD